MIDCYTLTKVSKIGKCIFPKSIGAHDLNNIDNFDCLKGEVWNLDEIKHYEQIESSWCAFVTIMSFSMFFSFNQEKCFQ